MAEIPPFGLIPMRTPQSPCQSISAALLFMTLVATAPSQGQEVGHGHWRTYGIEDGLPGLDVHAVLMDREGLLWFGTDGSGVSRYDGNEFKTFTTHDGLAGNSVAEYFESIFEYCELRRNSKEVSNVLNQFFM